jgi:hypothetical protein
MAKAIFRFGSTTTTSRPGLNTTSARRPDLATTITSKMGPSSSGSDTTFASAPGAITISASTPGSNTIPTSKPNLATTITSRLYLSSLNPDITSTSRPDANIIFQGNRIKSVYPKFSFHTIAYYEPVNKKRTFIILDILKSYIVKKCAAIPSLSLNTSLFPPY